MSISMTIALPVIGQIDETIFLAVFNLFLSKVIA
jgi:hypothetical protein